MIFNSILLTIIVYTAIILSIITIILSKFPFFRGWIGELSIRNIIGKTNTNKNKYVINNYLLEIGENKTSQIDHIIINTKGIIVIETKNYAGTIYGKRDDLNWKQVFNYGKTKNSFYNPIKQNATHCYNIKNLFKENIPVISIVCFNRANIKFLINCDEVINPSSLKRRIRRLPDLINVEQINKANEILTINNKRKEISNHKHIKNIKIQQNKINNNICPRCGGKLIERYGKYGYFYGCENYPKCKFIKKIEK